MAAFDLEGFLTAWNPGVTGGFVRALEYHDGILYAGGTFTSAGDGIGTIERLRLAAFDESGNLMSWNPSIGTASASTCSDVRSILHKDDIIYVGGGFSRAGGITRSGLAAFDLSGAVTSWAPLLTSGPTTCPSVSSINSSGSSIYIGGSFTQVASSGSFYDRSGLAAIDLSGNITSWSASVNGSVTSIVLDGGNVLVGGSFTSASGGAGGTTRLNFASFDELGNLNSMDIRFDEKVEDIAVDNGYLYAVGSFDEVVANGQLYGRQAIAAVDLSSQSVLPFSPVHNANSLSSIVLSDDVYVSGGFSEVSTPDGVFLRSSLSRFSSGGALKTN